MRKRIIYMLIALTQQAVSCPLGYEVEVNMSAAEDYFNVQAIFTQCISRNDGSAQGGKPRCLGV